jgi:hypothetical protein
MTRPFGKIGYLNIILALIILSLSVLVVCLGNQIIVFQEKVDSIKNQMAFYQNQSIVLQNQEENLTSQILQLETLPDNVTLSVVSAGSWYADPLTGYPYYKVINLTIQNNGVRNLGGMTLDSRIEGNTSNVGYVGINVDTNKGVLHPNESMNLTMKLVTQENMTKELEKYQLSITLLLDQTVLDQKTVPMGLLT